MKHVGRMPRACLACGRVTFLAPPKYAPKKRRPRRLTLAFAGAGSDPAMLRKKSETEKLAVAHTVFRSDRVFPPLLGANQRGPVEPIFDRFAMWTTRARARASGSVAHLVISTPSRYKQNVVKKSAAYKANQQIMIARLKSYTCEALLKHFRPI